MTQVLYSLVVCILMGFAVPAMVNLRCEVDDTNMSGLVLLPLGGDGAEAVGDLISFLGHVLPLDVWDVKEEVLRAILGNDKAVSLGAAEVPHLPLHLGVGDGYLTRGLSSGAAGDNGWRDL